MQKIPMQRIILIALIAIFAVTALMWSFPDKEDPSAEEDTATAVQQSVDNDAQSAAQTSEEVALDGLAVRAPTPGGGTIASSQKPPVASSRDIALMHARYAGMMPDFDAWALATDEYKNAPDIEKMNVQAQMSRSMLETFKLLTTGQPFQVDFPVTLGDYNDDLKGYLADSIKDDTFFPFSYMGKNYAVIVQQITNFQWLPVDDLAQAKAVDDLRLKSASQKDAVITFTLSPLSAEKEKPTVIAGVEYWMLAAKVSNVAIYDDTGTLLWQKTVTENDSATRDKIINLYK